MASFSPPTDSYGKNKTFGSVNVSQNMLKMIHASFHLKYLYSESFQVLHVLHLPPTFPSSTVTSNCHQCHKLRGYSAHYFRILFTVKDGR